MIAESGKWTVKVLAGRLPTQHEAGAEARGSHRWGGALGVAQTWRVLLFEAVSRRIV
jgi:hypothetical protein